MLSELQCPAQTLSWARLRLPGIPCRESHSRTDSNRCMLYQGMTMTMMMLVVGNMMTNILCVMIGDADDDDADDDDDGDDDDGGGGG